MAIDQRTVRNISSRTKEGDLVWDGPTQCEVLHRNGDALVMRDVYTGNYLCRFIKGGSRRHSSYESALEASGLPNSAASFDSAIAVTQAMLRAKAAA